MAEDYLYQLIILLSVFKIKSIYHVSNYLGGKSNEVKRTDEKKMSMYQHIGNLSLEPSFMIDNLFLGNAVNSQNEYTIKKFGIEKIINVTEELPCVFDDLEYLQIPIRDTRDNFIEKYLPDTIDFIEKHKNKQILVHCYMGSSRSAIVIVNYLVKIHNMDLYEAIKFVKRKRPLVNINLNFVNEIRNRNSINNIKKV